MMSRERTPRNDRGCGIALGCADQAQHGPGAPDDAPNSVEVVCRADGTNELGTTTVSARPARVHVVVRSHLKEPASADVRVG